MFLVIAGNIVFLQNLGKMSESRLNRIGKVYGNRSNRIGKVQE